MLGLGRGRPKTQPAQRVARVARERRGCPAPFAAAPFLALTPRAPFPEDPLRPEATLARAGRAVLGAPPRAPVPGGPVAARGPLGPGRRPPTPLGLDGEDVGEELPGVWPGFGRHRFRGAVGDDPAPLVAALGPEVDKPV